MGGKATPRANFLVVCCAYWRGCLSGLSGKKSRTQGELPCRVLCRWRADQGIGGVGVNEGNLRRVAKSRTAPPLPRAGGRGSSIQGANFLFIARAPCACTGAPPGRWRCLPRTPCCAARPLSLPRQPPPQLPHQPPPERRHEPPPPPRSRRRRVGARLVLAVRRRGDLTEGRAVVDRLVLLVIRAEPPALRRGERVEAAWRKEMAQLFTGCPP